MNNLIWKAVITCMLVICIWYEAECDINHSPAKQPLDSRADLIYSRFQNYIISSGKTMVSGDTSEPHMRYARQASETPRNPSKNRRNRRKGNRRRRQKTTEPTTTEPTTTEPTTTEPFVVLNVNSTERPPCIPCMWREERKRVRIQMIKEEILRKLKLDEPPTNVSYKNFPSNTSLIVPNHDNGTYSDQPAPEPEPVGDITRILTPATSPPWAIDERLGDVIYFDIKADILNSHLIKAELRIYVKPMNLQGVAYINLYQIIKDGEGDFTYDRMPNRRHKVILNTEGTGKYHTIKIAPLVTKWMSKGGKHNFGLRISAKTADDESFVVISTNINENKPQFWVEIDGDSSTRSRRSHSKDGIPDICEDISKEERCCRYHLLVNFEDFGSDWDWIIYPRTYQAFYCAGVCDFTDSNTKHAVVVQLSRGMDHLGGPCCTPIKSSPISMIYLDSSGRIIYSTLQDMVADKCGCN